MATIAPSLRGLLAGEGPLKVVTYDEAARAADYLESDAGRAAVRGGPLSPDHIVYAGSFPLLFEPPADAPAEAIPALLRDDLAQNVADHGAPPIITVVPGLGIFAAGDTYKEADLARGIYLDAMRVSEGADAIGQVRALSDTERGFIETWEVEAYRRNAAAFSRDRGRFGCRIALVTGAAQGFGLEISQDMIAQGGTVVLTDLNAQGAQAAAETINAQLGKPPRLGAAHQRHRWRLRGGSRLPGGPLRRLRRVHLQRRRAQGRKRQDPGREGFRFRHRRELQGLFPLRAEGRADLATQHKATGRLPSDIIQINSKSGLVGSNRNGAYAGSKFGGIGLTQSFALELIEDGIKVNSICPGNFFDGPLWSDPENGLFVQYLRTGKVPGAKTIDDVRQRLRSQGADGPRLHRPRT